MKKREALTSKLNNFIEFLKKPETFNLSPDSHYLNLLSSYTQNYNKFILDLSMLAKIADTDGVISDQLISAYLATQKLDWNNYPEDARVKFCKYLKCFIKFLNHDFI